MKRIADIVDLSNGRFDPPGPRSVVAPAWVTERAEVPVAVPKRLD